VSHVVSGRDRSPATEPGHDELRLGNGGWIRVGERRSHEIGDVGGGSACRGEPLLAVGLEFDESLRQFVPLHDVHGLAEEGRAVAATEHLAQMLEPLTIRFIDGEPDGGGLPHRNQDTSVAYGRQRKPEIPGDNGAGGGNRAGG
jgi:hypothetical protein